MLEDFGKMQKGVLSLHVGLFSRMGYGPAEIVSLLDVADGRTVDNLRSWIPYLYLSY